jgi:DNA-binding transcriptional MocR family regulator
LRTSRDHLRSELARSLPDWDVRAVSGGLSLWIGLGSPLSSSLALMCQARGLVLSAGPRFTVDGSQERYLRVPFTMSLEDLTAGVSVLSKAWASLSGFAGPGQPTAFHSVV